VKAASSRPHARALSCRAFPASALARFAESVRRHNALQLVQERLACDFQFLFETRRTVAIAAGPRFRPVLVFALAAVVRILHTRQVEILFPVRPLFLQGSWAIAHLYPTRGVIRTQTCLLHVTQIFTFGDRSLSQGLLLDGVEQIRFTTGFYSGSNQITHECLTAAPPAPAFPGTGSGCACRSTEPPSCRCGRRRSSWEFLPLGKDRSPCVQDRAGSGSRSSVLR
jgi:hypothetical protein